MAGKLRARAPFTFTWSPGLRESRFHPRRMSVVGLGSSKFQFTVRHMGVGRFSASFDDFDATVVGDEQGVRVEGAVRVESVSIKQPDFRAHVVSGADFFDGSNYPELSFRSTNVVLNDDGTASFVDQVAGRWGNALAFDGDVGRVVVADSPALTPARMTVMAWGC